MILVTGAAGFIGFHVASKLLKEGHQVIGLDNLNSYYDVKLKKSRLEILSKSQNFTFLELHFYCLLHFAYLQVGQVYLTLSFSNFKNSVWSMLSHSA